MTTQHERDLETGLDYRGARFYDSDLGRFLSLDPLAADFPDWSDYNYVLGNPIILVDADGRSPSSPIYDEDGNHLGNDSEGFKGEIIIMSKGKYNRLTNNGEKVLDHSEVIKMAESNGGKGIDRNEFVPEKVQKINQAGLSIKAYQNVLTHVVKQLDGEKFDRTTLKIDKLEGGKIQIANEVVGDFGYKERKLYGTATNPASEFGGTLVRENGDINVTAVLSNGINKHFDTVENIQNSLGIHEYYSHGVKGIKEKNGDHHKSYELQKKHRTYEHISDYMKEDIEENIK